MSKCVVSTCPNRTVTVNRNPQNRIPQRPAKRFFQFPKDPATVKVWLAALRELDKQDPAEQHVICEDHFLPEDISNNQVNTDAVPIMPPDLDGPPDHVSPWGVETLEEEEQWTSGGCDGEDDGDDPQKGSGSGPEEPPGSEVTSCAESQEKQWSADDTCSRYGVSLRLLTRRFLQLLLTAPDASLDIGQVAESLQTSRRRISDITDVLVDVKLLQQEALTRIRWTGKVPISRVLQKSEQKLQRELKKLQQVEDTLDGLIRSCAQQLFDMTDDEDNAASAYVTHEDIRRLNVHQEETLVLIRAPEETKLEVPAPTEDRVQIHLKSGRGPIMMMTCEVGSDVTSDPGQTGSGFFLTLEESRVKMTSLHKVS